MNWIEYWRRHLYLQRLGPLRNTSSDFIILMRDLMCQEICLQSRASQGPFFDRKDYWKHFIAMDSWFFWAGHLTNQNLFQSNLLCCDWMQYMRRLPVLIHLRFWESVKFPFLGGRVWFYFFVSPFALLTLEVTFRRLSTGNFVIPVAETARHCFTIIVRTLYCIHRL